MIKRIIKKFEAKEGNKKKGRLGDRGAALVSVLIAITFIAIIATSLLYMVYMNYLAKVMRYGSTDNFYTAEFALDDLSSEIQQVAVDRGLAGGSISTAIGDIRGKVGASSGSSTYDNDKVAALIKAASQEADIKVSTAVTGNNYEDNSKSYVKLKGVVITATDEKGYVSTITSDIIIKFSADGGGELDICDFSVLTDDPVYIGGGDFIMTGCGYMQRHDGSGEVNGVPSGYCLYINGGACAQILSERAILNGKVKMAGNSVMSISGKVYVFGDIELDADSTLIVTGDLKLTGKVKGSGKVLKKDTDSIEENWTYPGGDKCPLYKDTSKKGLVTQLFCSKVLFWNSYNNPGSWDYMDFNTYGGNDEQLRVQAKTEAYKYAGKGTNLQMCSPDVNNSAFENTLALIPNKACYIKGTCTNSTIVSLNGYRFNGSDYTNPSYMQKMDREQYNWLINSCFPGIKRNEGQIKDPSGNSMNSQFKGPDGDPGKFGTQMPTTGLSAYDKKTYTYNGEPRTVYKDSSGVCYMPIKYLLDDDTAGIITDLFDSLSGDSDPTKSTVVYENWSKE